MSGRRQQRRGLRLSRPPGFTVSGNVWNDNGGTAGTAGDGVKDGDEAGISGVTVTLYKDVNNDNVYDAGDTVFATGTTDGSGNYSFAGVPNGEYVVKVDTATLGSTAFVQTGDPDSGCPADGCNSQSDVTVSGGNPAAENFGYRREPRQHRRQGLRRQRRRVVRQPGAGRAVVRGDGDADLGRHRRHSRHRLTT